MCSCSASTQTAVYETMESAGGTSNRACSIGGLGGMKLCWKETNTAAAQVEQDKVPLWHRGRGGRAERPPAKTVSSQLGSQSLWLSKLYSCVATMTCVVTKGMWGGLSSTFICVKPLENAFHPQRHFLLLTSFVVSVKGFRACRSVPVSIRLKATFIEPFSVHTSLNKVWATWQTCSAPSSSTF